MEIKSKGYVVTYKLDEATALMKLIGNSTLDTLVKHFGLTREEAENIQGMYSKLVKLLPRDSEAG
jgi:endonuclease III